MQVGPIFWQGQRYEPWAIQAEGFEQVGEGQQPSPTLRVGNIGQDAQGRPLAGVISSLCVHLDDLVGARVVARRTLGRYLDAANFPEGNPSADRAKSCRRKSGSCSRRRWRRRRWSSSRSPARSTSMARSCPTGPSSPACARGCARAAIAYCGYTGGRMFDLNGNRVTDPTLDRCSGLMSDCKKRFGEYEVINFGGFPSADLIRASMRKKTLQAIRDHGVAAYPLECCGLVLKAGRREWYQPCRNTAASAEHFVMSAEDYAAAEESGDIVAVVHSHPDAPAAPARPIASPARRRACPGTSWRWKSENGDVVAGEIRGFAPEGYRAPLLGRQFAHGVLDCYTLVRDWYARERDIVLPDFSRDDGWWEPGKPGDLYMDHYAEAGFRPAGR